MLRPMADRSMQQEIFAIERLDSLYYQSCANISKTSLFKLVLTISIYWVTWMEGFSTGVNVKVLVTHTCSLCHPVYFPGGFEWCLYIKASVWPAAVMHQLHCAKKAHSVPCYLPLITPSLWFPSGHTHIHLTLTRVDVSSLFPLRPVH